MAATREQLRQLVDAPPEEDLDAVACYLQSLASGDPALRTLATAPLGDEPLTDRDRAAIGEAREQARRGQVKSLEEVRRELGLRPAR